MGRVYGTHVGGAMREKFWYGTEGKQRLGKRWEDNIKMPIKETVGA